MSDTTTPEQTPAAPPRTGPEHYAEAGRLLADVAEGFRIIENLERQAGGPLVGSDPMKVAAFHRSVDVGIARAQAHATAAQAASAVAMAKVLAAALGKIPIEAVVAEFEAWQAVAGGTIHNPGAPPVNGDGIVWTVIVADPRADNEPWLFSDREQAVDFASKWANDRAGDPAHIEALLVAGCAYFARYRTPDLVVGEVRVVGKKLNQAVAG